MVDPSISWWDELPNEVDPATAWWDELPNEGDPVPSLCDDLPKESDDPVPSSVERLKMLLTRRGRKPVTQDQNACKRRVMRGNGLAAKAAALIEAVIEEVNEVHGLQSFPLQLRAVLGHMADGRNILKECETAKHTKILAQGALEVVAKAGRACAGEVLGSVAKPNKEGQIPAKKLAEITKKSVSWINTSKRNAVKGVAGTFSTQSKPRVVQHVVVPDEEEAATRWWTREENPARSGDKQVICWMVKTKERFYEDDYRSVPAQKDIITHALENDSGLLERVKNPKNVWHHNVRKYLAAKKEGNLSKLRIHTKSPQGPSDMTEALALAERHEEEGASEDLDLDKEEGAEEEQAEEENEDDELTLHPRTYKCFYNSILKNERLWQRPPDNACERCNEFEVTRTRIQELTTALLISSQSSHPEYAKHKEMVERAGGSQAAWAEQRALTAKFPSLEKHVEWKAYQRKYLKNRENNLEDDELLLQLDYGGFTDSNGRKSSAWSATVMGKNREQENFDFFFNAANQNNGKDDPGAKKNGTTGVYFLRELLDPSKNPDDQTVSFLKMRYPNVKRIILSGDTGNGFRAYLMCEELSTVMPKFDLSVELIPLSPAHAHNRTDARFAHMNTKLKAVKKVSRVYGARGMAQLFSAFSSIATEKNKNKPLARCHVFFREVDTDSIVADLGCADGKNFGVHVKNKFLDKGHMGVHGLLYFNFSVEGEAGKPEYPRGWARVREHGDPEKVGNKTYLWTWRKDLDKKHCMPCGDRMVVYYS